MIEAHCAQCKQHIIILSSVGADEAVFCSEKCEQNWILDNPDIPILEERSVIGFEFTEDDEPPAHHQV